MMTTVPPMTASDPVPIPMAAIWRSTMVGYRRIASGVYHSAWP